MRTLLYISALAVVLAVSSPASAAETVTDEPDEATYNFVSHYRTTIDAPANVVWKHLINVGAWMYDFEMSHVSGEPGKEGEVLRLYPEQDFFVQITSLVPNQALTMVNLPSTFNGEYSTGIGVITLNEPAAGKTTVDLTMSRRYSRAGEGANPMKATRESAEFMEGTRATWKKFLERLRTLAEST